MAKREKLDAKFTTIEKSERNEVDPEALEPQRKDVERVGEGCGAVNT
jgi:hypothetical protein